MVKNGKYIVLFICKGLKPVFSASKSYKNDCSAFVCLPEKILLTETAYYGDKTKKNRKRTLFQALKLNQFFKKPSINKTTTTINLKYIEFFTAKEPKKLQDFAHKLPIKHMCTVLELFFQFLALAKLLQFI